MQQNNKPETDPAEAFLKKVTEVIVPSVQDLETKLVKITEVQEQLKINLNDIKKEVSVVASMVEHIELKAPDVDISRFESQACNWYQKILMALNTYPKKHYFRILFFPEHNTLEYLKKIWGRVFKWLFLIISVLSLYFIIVKWIDKYYAEPLYKKAWETLYDSQDASGRKIMKQVLKQLQD